MFNDKFNTWYNSLPKHTQIWLKNQPLWHDRDMIVSFLTGVFMGALVVWIL